MLGEGFDSLIDRKVEIWYRKGRGNNSVKLWIIICDDLIHYQSCKNFNFNLDACKDSSGE